MFYVILSYSLATIILLGLLGKTLLAYRRARMKSIHKPGIAAEVQNNGDRKRDLESQEK